jgi:uncharacterized protein YndB with AHSA1/START domain
MINDPVIVQVSRRHAVPSEAVFDIWLNPVLVGQFMFGPLIRDEEVLHARNDPRVGGAFSFLVWRQGTEIDHLFSATPPEGFSPATKPGKIVWLWTRQKLNAKQFKSGARC